MRHSNGTFMVVAACSGGPCRTAEAAGPSPDLASSSSSALRCPQERGGKDRHVVHVAMRLVGEPGNRDSTSCATRYLVRAIVFIVGEYMVGALWMQGPPACRSAGT